MKTVKIESEEWVSIQETNNIKQSIQLRIGSHEERIMELQQEQRINNQNYTALHTKLCSKYKLNPKEQVIFEPKMNPDIVDKKK